MSAHIGLVRAVCACGSGWFVPASSLVDGALIHCDDCLPLLDGILCDDAEDSAGQRLAALLLPAAALGALLLVAVLVVGGAR